MNPQKGELYKHANGKEYEILHIANAAWDINQSLVVYQLANTDSETKVVWVRSMTEFCDGRFRK